MGVCKSCEAISTVTVKSSGKEVSKRDVQIVDQSGSEV